MTHGPYPRLKIIEFNGLIQNVSLTKLFCCLFQSYADRTVPFILSQYGSEEVIPLFVF